MGRNLGRPVMPLLRSLDGFLGSFFYKYASPDGLPERLSKKSNPGAERSGLTGRFALPPFRGAEKWGVWVITKIVFLGCKKGHFSTVTKAAWILAEVRVVSKKAIFDKSCQAYRALPVWKCFLPEWEDEQ